MNSDLADLRLLLEKLKSYGDEADRLWDRLSMECFDDRAELNGTPLEYSIQQFAVTDASLTNEALEGLARLSSGVGIAVESARLRGTLAAVRRRDPEPEIEQIDSACTRVQELTRDATILALADFSPSVAAGHIAEADIARETDDVLNDAMLEADAERQDLIAEAEDSICKLRRWLFQVQDGIRGLSRAIEEELVGDMNHG